MSARPMLAPDAAMVLGIAATAIPFARTSEDQAERWLRVLRLHGEVGVALQALGVSEMSLPRVGANGERESGASAQSEQRDCVALVTDHAARIAAARDAPGVSTTDVLLAVMSVYGTDFERVLRAHGANPDEVLERLGAPVTESVDG
jgi:hypothetical protein